MSARAADASAALNCTDTMLVAAADAGCQVRSRWTRRFLSPLFAASAEVSKVPRRARAASLLTSVNLN